MDLWKKIVGQNWAFYSHRKLYDMVRTEAAGVSAMEPADENWARFVALMAESRDDIDDALKEAGANWQGLAAEAMTGGVTPLAQWAEDAGTAGTASNSGLSQVGATFAFVANAMPEPVPTTFDPGGVPPHLPYLLGAQLDQDARERAAQEAKQRAVELMQAYSRNSHAAVTSLGIFVPPRDVAVGTAAAGTAAQPVSQAGGQIVTAPPGAVEHPAGTGRTGAPPAVSGPPGGTVRNSTPVPAGAGQLTPTTTSSVGPGAPPPAPGGAPSGGADAFTGRPPVGFDPITGLPVVPRTAGPAIPVPGGDRLPGAGPAGRGQTGGTVREMHATEGRATGLGGPMAPGARSRDEDGEHASPQYLHGYHDAFWHGDSLVGPAVIGDDTREA